MKYQYITYIEKMKYLVDNQIVEIEDKYISYSPFLSTLSTTYVRIDKNNDIPILDLVYDQFIEYKKFLEGLDFNMDSDIEILFDFMGHPNVMKYPLSYWKVKLQDNWIRDNFYKLELYNDPYYGLIQLQPISDRIKHLPIDKNIYIAGGYALYLAGYTDSYSDIDYFFCNKEDGINFMTKYGTDGYASKDMNGGKDMVNVAGHCITVNRYHKYTISNPDPKITKKKTLNMQLHIRMQFIMRLYKSPSEIIHGFDVDCVGILWDGKSLWCTKRAKYCLDNKVNFFDPTRSSPSYAFRLSKYKIRGFDIWLPFVTKGNVNMKKVEKLYEQIQISYDIAHQQEIDDNIDNDFLGDIAVSNPKEKLLSLIQSSDSIVSHMTLRDLIDELESIAFSCDKYVHTPKDTDEGYNKYGSMLRYISSQCNTSGENCSEIKKHLPKDPQSILLLSEFEKFHTGIWRQTDYEKGTSRQKICNIYEALDKSKWIEQDPMKQVSSTFYPEPISPYEIIGWFKKSPLYIE